jgi:hypothetical protein
MNRHRTDIRGKRPRASEEDLEMSRDKKQKAAKRGAVLLTLLGVLMAGTIALAAWTAGGTGSGYAKATTAQNLTTVDVSGSTTAQLYPGGTGDLKLSVTNPNAYAVTITSVAGSGTITSDKGAACNASTGVSYTTQSSLSQVVGAGATVPFTLTGSVAMSNASDNTCQGAVFTVPVTLTGTS